MDTLKEKQRAISLSSNSETMSVSGTSIDSFANQSNGRQVRFAPAVKVAMLPWQEREDARKARMGQWKPAPMSDELWDGDCMSFRPDELTAEEFKAIMSHATKRRKSPLPRSFAILFSSAPPTNMEGKIAGVDIIHARARVYAEDFDEEVRDSNGRLEDSFQVDEEAVDKAIVKLSAEQVGEDLVWAFKRISATSNAPALKRPSGEKMTRFIPSPPTEPSPSERASGLSSAAVSLPSRKKSSNASIVFSTAQPFVCGEGKRSTLFLGEEPIKDETEQWNEPPELPGKSSKMRKKKSILGRMFGVLAPTIVT